MTPEGVEKIRTGIKERLQYMQKYDKDLPYSNELNTKGVGFPVFPIMVLLVAIAISIGVKRTWNYQNRNKLSNNSEHGSLAVTLPKDKAHRSSGP